MAEHVRARQGWFGSLQRLQVTVNGIDETKVTAEEAKTHLQTAERIWKKLDDAHEKILATTADDAAVTVQQTALAPMEDCLAEIQKKLYRFQSTVNANRKTTNIKLPRIPLPTFSGNYEDWTTFRDLFIHDVHNDSSLSASHKLQYLKSCTAGDAAAIIKSFVISDVNYTEAWNMLEQQYHHQRDIVDSHVRNIVFQPSVKADSATSLQSLLITTLENIRCLKVLGRPTDKWDDILIVLIVDKFDSDTKSEWAKTLKGTDSPTFKELEDFIKLHIRILNAKGTVKQSSSKQQSSSQSRKINANHTSVSSCQVCSGNHQMYQCAKLKEMQPDKRFAAVKATGVCLNCMKEGHMVRDCKSTGTCRKCEKKHNTFLHCDQAARKNNNSSQPQGSSGAIGSADQQHPSSSSTSNIRINTSSFAAQSPTLLKTALVDVMDTHNVKQTLRVFIDEGAEGGLIREARMNQLGLIKEKVDVTISGVGGATATKSKWKTYVTLYSQVNNSSIDVELFAVPKLTGGINKMETGGINWSHIEGLQLADPHFHDGGEVDILLGSDAAPYILLQGLKKSLRNAPVAQETIFGWVLSGNVGGDYQSNIHIHNVKCEISDALRKFWEIEEISTQQSLTQEEAACENHFVKTHYILPDGRYGVRLPFNHKKEQLGESRSQALRRLFSLEKRFDKHPQHKKAYVEFMREYKQLGHMESCSSSVNKVKSTFYLPHHFVLKADSTTTKQRTVFDGSAKTTTGVSLNEALLVGATVQSDLYTLLLRFRYNKIALKADIAKMYRQFVVHEDDRDYQRILWREDSHQPIQEYRLTTVTYGTASAPFLATRCLNQLAANQQHIYPEAADALLKSTYVDDLLGSSESKESAIELVRQMREITATAGMEIRKWCSNDPDVMSSIPEHLREEGSLTDFNGFDSSSSIKALGIKWQPSTDMFLFGVNIEDSTTVTKRFLLSEISKTFDPVGWLSPVTINAKLLLQKVWIAGNNWDEEVSAELQDEWKVYINSLMEIRELRIPRCVMSSVPLHAELHGFSDSSELAYSSSVYLKCVYQDNVTVNLITSRTRVAPIKTVSLPKLELCGAKLLAETVESVRKSLNIPHTLFCWTDSTITLRWITSHSRRWKTFVANRVSDIQTIVPPEHWHHVRSEDNPADLPSRGITAHQLITSELWWHGPSWLKQDTYPIVPQQYDEEEAKKEERSKQLVCFHLSSNSTYNKLFSAFSSLPKLYRSCVYLIRYIQYLKSKKSPDSIIKTNPTATEILMARRKLVQWVQGVSFPEDVCHLQKFKRVSSSSKLLSLTPFIAQHGILRVGGRIQNSSLPESSRHPIILPHNHHFTQLVIRDAHHVLLHGGFTLTYSTLRRDYWIMRGRDTIRHELRRCTKCRKMKAATTNQLMGNLPAGRVTASRPFLHTGVDFAGPFQTKLKKGRHFAIEKTYFAIFVCLSTKAVHLEAVTSLSSEAFIACYERFVSRRGICAQIYSDCGTNFVGADRMLKEFLHSQQSTLEREFTTRGTTWNFNPPASPHQGGIWEAGVKSVKFHLRRVMGQNILHLEQFQTLLCKIEACLNSRPLCALSSDPADLEALTPGHFIIGEPLCNIPEPDVSLIKENRLKYWEIVRQKTQHFWRRWTNEYLTSLQQRHKWTRKNENLQVGDLVVVADDQMPVAKWKLGRVIIVHPGVDGLVRSATVKTVSGELKRPVTKLCPLLYLNEQ